MFEKYKKTNKFTSLDFLNSLKHLLPKGQLWGFNIYSESGDAIQDSITETDILQDSISETNIIQDTIFVNEGDVSDYEIAKYFYVFAREIKRFFDNLSDLWSESIPGLSSDLLPNWLETVTRDNNERQLYGDDIDTQRVFAHAKYYNNGQTTDVEYFERYGEQLGFDLMVEENPTNLNAALCSGYSQHDPSVIGSPESRCSVQSSGLKCSRSLGVASILQITINAGTGNFELMKELFYTDKPAHVVIVWIDNRP